MAGTVQILRTTNTANVPAAGTYLAGVPYVNFANKQFGVVDSLQNPQDLIAVRYFSDVADYPAESFVVHDSGVYFNPAPVTAGPWDATEWTPAGSATFFTNMTWTGPAGVNTFNWLHFPDQLSVFLNGSKLIRNVDYQSVTGNAPSPKAGSIVLTKPLFSADDVLDAFSFEAFNVANAITRTDAEILFAGRASAPYLFPSIVELKAYDIATPNNPYLAVTRGSTVAGDGLEGIYLWDGTSAATENLPDVVRPTGIAGAGRWIRAKRFVVDPLVFLPGVDMSVAPVPPARGFQPNMVLMHTGAKDVAIHAGYTGLVGLARRNDLFIYDGSAWRTLEKDYAIQFATAAEILAGTVTDKIIAPDQLRANTVTVSTGAADTNKLVRLNAAGLLDATFTEFATHTEILDGNVDNKPIAPKQLRTHTLNAPTGGTANAADTNRLVRLNNTGTFDIEFIPFKPTQFSSAAEIVAAAVTDKAIAPDQLRASTVNAFVGAADVNKLVRLGATGKLDNNFLVYATVAEIGAGTVNNKPIAPDQLRAYILATPSTGSASAADANKIVGLGAGGLIDFGFIPVATQAEVTAGTISNKVVAPDTLDDVYLKKADAAAVYLTAANASATYATKASAVNNVKGVTGIWKGTQAEYNALTPDPNTFYIII